MILSTQQHALLPESLPTLVVATAAVVACAAWLALHFVRGPRWWRRAAVARAVAAVLVGSAALTGTASWAGRFFVLATNWPVWPLLLGGAIAVELICMLYGLERRIAARRWGRWLVACRVALVLAVIAMLVQPVRSLDLSTRLDRSVAILLDDSASMHVADTQLRTDQKIRLAEAVSRGAILRPYRFEEIARRLEQIREEIQTQATALAAIGGTTVQGRGEYLLARREAIRSAIATWQEQLAREHQAIGEPVGGKLNLGKAAQAVIKELQSELSVRVRETLARSSANLASGSAGPLGRGFSALLSAHRRAAAALGEIAAKTTKLGRSLDAACYGALSEEDRGKVDAAAGRSRIDLAREILTGPSGLLAQIGDRYGVKLYSFGADTVLRDPTSLARPPAASGPAPARETNLAAALHTAASESPGRELAGVIVLTDGRHNVADPVEPVARRLGGAGVPVSSVLMGSERGPVDAAVTSADAPETIYLKDQTYITARLKLDGLAGKSVRVELREQGRVLDSRQIQAPSDSWRTEIQLADEPKTIGPHAYRIVVESQDGEAFTDNNAYPLTVQVTDERTRMLIVEGRSRWEFRYLKNLFTGRDRAVRLQYVLLQRDRITGRPEPPAIAASASRPPGKVEATALPAGEAEWLKFDVIVLGDVAPAALTGADVDAIRTFVVDRGGTLIVIGGANHMPHAYAATMVADLLPVVFEASDMPVPAARDEAYRIALTPDGRRSVVMRQGVDEAASRRIWDSFPVLYSRYPSASAKPGATVLAYAMGSNAPEYMRAESASDTRRQREKFVRDHALIACHNVSGGKVMFLAFDRTWRMRYRAGDTHHHRFWGQVLRWATSGKLGGGTQQVKLGTDRPHYRIGQRVRVRARIVRDDFSPVITDDVAVNVMQGGKRVLRKGLRAEKGPGGMYSADLGELPRGSYEVELDAPAAAPLLKADGVTKLETRFSVDSTAPVEQIELGADRSVPASVAAETGGVVVEPAQASDVLAVLAAPQLVHAERKEVSLWDSWPWLLSIISIATCEWVIRKKAALA